MATVRGEDAAEAIRDQAAAAANLETIRGAIEEITSLLPEVVESEGRQAAERWLSTGLKRACGSVRSEVVEDEKRVVSAVEALVAAL
jgi:hypothetical protein